MTVSLSRWFALLLLVLPFVPVVAVAPDDKDIDRLIKQLGSSDFHMREAATKRLKEISAELIEALRKAETSDDLEVRRRAEQIVAGIEKEFRDEQLAPNGFSGLLCQG